MVTFNTTLAVFEQDLFCAFCAFLWLIIPAPELSSELDDTSTNSNRDRLSTVIGAEFLHDVFNVDLDGFFGDEQSFANVLIPVPFGEMRKNLYLSRS